MNQNTRLLISILLATVVFATFGCWETTDFLCKPGTDDIPTSTDTVTGEGEGEGEGEGSATDTGTGTGTEDSDTIPDNVEEGDVCLSVFGPLGAITGICQQAEAQCDGGFASPDPVLPFYVGKDPAFNCKGDLLCCIDTDQCAAIDVQLKTNPQIAPFLPEGAGATCVETGTCSEPGYIIGEEFGCPAGETCCLITSE